MQTKITYAHCTLITLLCGLSSISCADDTISTDTDNTGLAAEYILGLAMTAGGDELADVQLVDDDGDNSSDNIKAGGFLYFYGGIQFETPAFPLRFTLGHFSDSIDASNGSVSFSRIPLELLGLHTTGPHTVGIGPTYHLSPELDLKDAGYGSYEADNTLGLVLMYEYTFESNLALGVRYTNISYDFNGTDIDGNNFGILMEMKF
jgi:hypothetical protein